MTITSILLFASAERASPESGPAACAIALASAHRASLTALVVALDVTTPGAAADPVAVAASIGAAATAAGVDCRTVTGHSHAIGVHEAIADHARTHDLTVAGCDDAGLLSERQIAEYLLFESGRPLIVVPAGYTGGGTGTVAVAWDNTPAAARALGDAKPLIGTGEAVLLTIDGDKQIPGELDADALLLATRRRGITARPVNAAKGGRTIAEALQDEAIAAGAGLLAMGGYGHSRLRRFILGSATAGLLAAPRLPTLLSH